VGLERGPLSLVSTIEELLGRKSSSSGLVETENTAVGIRHDHVAPYTPKLAYFSPTSGGCSVGIVRSQTRAPEFLPIDGSLLTFYKDVTLWYTFQYESHIFLV
jgi:hypothetical protein